MSDNLLPAGARIGKYEVMEHIASGGMAEVYKARDPDLGRPVALKVLPDHLADNPTILERFRREARNSAHLAHKNIVTVYEWGEEQGLHFLAMEYVEGTDLHNYICEKGRLDPKEAWVILVQATRALEHACRQGIIHRDIKPSNLLLSFRSDNKVVVKLADLGLARAMHPNDFRVTKDGTTVGTIDYMAPEQARDSALADVRSDIYSLGCTLYHMLAGQPPFPDGGLGERIYKHLNSEVQDVRIFNRRVPAVLWVVLKKMLEKDPADRYQSPEELLQVLLHLHDSEKPVEPSRKANLTSVSKTPTQSKTPSLDWRKPTVEGAASLEPIIGENVDPRVAAKGQYERAKVVVATDNQELSYARELLVSCCHLDPGNITYRKTLRQVGQALQQEKRWSRLLGQVSVWTFKARLKVAQTAGDHLKVLEQGEEILARAPEDIPTQIAMAEAARSLEMQELATWILEQMCMQAPDNPDLLRLLARSYEREDEIDKALSIWNGVLKLLPYDLEARRKADKLSVQGTLRRGHLGR